MPLLVTQAEATECHLIKSGRSSGFNFFAAFPDGAGEGRERKIERRKKGRQKEEKREERQESKEKERQGGG